MSHVIRSFHPDARLPETQDELAGIYRSVLDVKKVLLLMDNVANREQVEPLTPPRGCLLLVTSRFRFSLPGLVAKDLDELSAAEAQDLLLRIEPRIGKSAAEIARLCGNLPIALRLAAGALSERPDLSPGEYARRLTGTQKRSRLVDACLSVSYELLSDELRQHWRELGVFPGSFDAAGAAAVWAMELEAAEEVLGTLVKSSLVDWHNGRYRLHDLARAFAESQMKGEEATEARLRHAEHYAEVLAAADDLYLEGGQSVLKGLQLYDLEWDNVEAGQKWAAEWAEADETAARLCSRYPEIGVYCLDLRQPKRERIRWLESAISAAQRIVDHPAEGRHLGNLGNAYADLGDARRAIELYEQRLQIAREIDDRRGESRALCNLGNAYADLGDARRAIEFYEQDLPIAREIGDRRGESTVLGSLGLAYANLGDAGHAIQLYEQWLQIAREIGDRLGEGQALCNLGNAYLDLGDARRAMELYEHQLRIAREIGDRVSAGKAGWNLGLRYEEDGDLERAVELMQPWVDYLREIGHQVTEDRAARVEDLRTRLREERNLPREVSAKQRGTAIQPRSGDRL
jgi:tetratricopeptide (TPR) repeat protein